MSDRGIRKFCIKYEKDYSWHFGGFFCIEPKSEVNGKRDIYLLLCFGLLDIGIGFITDYDKNS